MTLVAFKFPHSTSEFSSFSARNNFRRKSWNYLEINSSGGGKILSRLPCRSIRGYCFKAGVAVSNYNYTLYLGMFIRHYYQLPWNARLCRRSSNCKRFDARLQPANASRLLSKLLYKMLGGWIKCYERMHSPWYNRDNGMRQPSR